MICCKTGPKNAKAAKKHCDKLFSYLIRSIGYCERCGRQPPEVKLETSHWISRRYSNIRVDPDNAFCFCSACHRWWHDFPTDASDWAINVRGRDVHDRLREAANETSKVDWFEQHDILQELVEEAYAV